MAWRLPRLLSHSMRFRSTESQGGVRRGPWYWTAIVGVGFASSCKRIRPRPRLVLQHVEQLRQEVDPSSERCIAS